MMNPKPLLEEKEEKIVFAQNDFPKNANKKGWKDVLNSTVILTIILTFIIVYFFGRTAYGFYLGFKYFDLRYVEVTTNVEE